MSSTKGFLFFSRIFFQLAKLCCTSSQVELLYVYLGSSWNKISIPPLMIQRLPELAKQKQIPKVNKKLIPIVGIFTIKFRNNYVIVLYFYCVCSVVLVSVCIYQCVVCSFDCFVSVSNI